MAVTESMILFPTISFHFHSYYQNPFLILFFNSFFLFFLPPSSISISPLSKLYSKPYN